MILGYIGTTILIAGAYVFLLIYILSKWTQTDDFVEVNVQGALSISFIIAARNEGKNIKACLKSILNNINSSQLEAEIIVINDHSDDNTVSEIESLNESSVKLIHLVDIINDDAKINAYKKMALNHALSIARGDYLIQLDADVVLPNDYLHKVNEVIQASQADLIAAPVLFKSDGSHFQNFQSLDMMGMMAVTAAGISSGKWYMANGANMIYKKGQISFENGKFASGDDMSAIMSIAKKQGKIEFLKNSIATVVTNCEPDIPSFYNQRIRWATKNKYLKGGWIKVVMAIPYLNVMWILFHLIATVLIGPTALIIGVFHLLSKVGIDYIYLQDLSSFFEEREVMKSFWYSSVAHVLYLAIIGTLSLVVRKYEWKGRKVS